MKVRFWGTRGSIAQPGETTLRHGGNTSCVQVVSDAGTLVVLDVGTGSRMLGSELAAGPEPCRGYLLVGHTHWDHIQGFPFFRPLFQPGATWDIHAPGGRARTLETALAGQMSYNYFPITLDALAATIRFHDLVEGSFDCGDIRVTAQYLNHPALTLGYRLHADGATVVYATDHEPHSLYPLDGEAGALPVHHEDLRHVKFLIGADLVVHDTQYTLADFPEKAGWGHTPMERAVDYALAAGVRRLALFHHDPDRTDDQVDELVERARELVASVDGSLEVFAASEGDEIELASDEPEERPPIPAERLAIVSDRPTEESHSILVVEDEPEMARFLKDALQPEDVEIHLACDGQAGLDRVIRDRPSLVLLDLGVPSLDGYEVCRRIRADPDPAVADTPVIILTGAKLSERDVIAAFAAGATDYLTKPVAPTLLRTRVHEWLIRTR